MKTCASLIAAQDVIGQLIQANTDGTWTVYEIGDTLPEGVFGEPNSQVPQEVSRRQFYRALKQLAWFGSTDGDIESAVEAFIDALPEPPREDARIDWRQSSLFVRSNPMLCQMLPALGKTQEDLDALFTLAASFE